jgi:hypothetical protein
MQFFMFLKKFKDMQRPQSPSGPLASASIDLNCLHWSARKHKVLSRSLLYQLCSCACPGINRDTMGTTPQLT